MLAMVLERFRAGAAAPLVARQLSDPVPGPGELLLRVQACAVCRTDLHLVDGELEPPAALPRVPGHQVVGVIEHVNGDHPGLAVGDQVGVPWLGGTCGTCRFCRSRRENLCSAATFTGYTADGGYAELLKARADYVFPLAAVGAGDPAAVAPLLCAGMIGYRAYRRTWPALDAADGALALYGYGSAARLLLAAAPYSCTPGRATYVSSTRHAPPGRPGREAPTWRRPSAPPPRSSSPPPERWLPRPWRRSSGAAW